MNDTMHEWHPCLNDTPWHTMTEWHTMTLVWTVYVWHHAWMTPMSEWHTMTHHDWLTHHDGSLDQPVAHQPFFSTGRRTPLYLVSRSTLFLYNWALARGWRAHCPCLCDWLGFTCFWYLVNWGEPKPSFGWEPCLLMRFVLAWHTALSSTQTRSKDLNFGSALKLQTQRMEQARSQPFTCFTSLLQHKLTLHACSTR